MAAFDEKSPAQRYISKMLDKEIPYTVDICGYDFHVTHGSVYPPGKLTRLFLSYLLDEVDFQGKLVADVGAGLCAVGMVLALRGAKKAVGTDVNEYAVECAQENIERHRIAGKVSMIHGAGLDPLHSLKGQVDILVSGVPWETLSESEFKQIDGKDRQLLSRAFYDVQDQLFTAVLQHGKDLLAPQGRIFVTACMRIMPRVARLCEQHGVTYEIVREKDIHHDGNIHYILELFF